MLDCRGFLLWHRHSWKPAYHPLLLQLQFYVTRIFTFFSLSSLCPHLPDCIAASGVTAGSVSTWLGRTYASERERMNMRDDKGKHLQFPNRLLNNFAFLNSNWYTYFLSKEHLFIELLKAFRLIFARGEKWIIIGQGVADQIYWRGLTVIKKGQQAKWEMLRLGNGAIHGPITHHSAREAEEGGEEGLQQGWGEMGGWGQAGETEG